jgi:hypothetical protein
MFVPESALETLTDLRRFCVHKSPIINTFSKEFQEVNLELMQLVIKYNRHLLNRLVNSENLVIRRELEYKDDLKR